MRTSEVERSVRHVHEFAGRDERGRDRHEAVGAERHAVVEDAALAGEIEEDVVGQVTRRRGVGRRREIDRQLVGGVGQGIGDGHGERARVALFAVRADIGQADRRSIGRTDCF